MEARLFTIFREHVADGTTPADRCARGLPSCARGPDTMVLRRASARIAAVLRTPRCNAGQSCGVGVGYGQLLVVKAVNLSY